MGTLMMELILEKPLLLLQHKRHWSPEAVVVCKESKIEKNKQYCCCVETNQSFVHFFCISLNKYFNAFLIKCDRVTFIFLLKNASWKQGLLYNIYYISSQFITGLA